jgi:hypothetical protein
VPRRKVHLTNIGHVSRELSRLYNRADRGETAWSDANLASLILTRLRASLEASDLEQRLAAIEQLLAERDRPAHRTNGHGRAVDRRP